MAAFCMQSGAVLAGTVDTGQSLGIKSAVSYLKKILRFCHLQCVSLKTYLLFVVLEVDV